MKYFKFLYEIVILRLFYTTQTIYMHTYIIKVYILIQDKHSIR